MSRRMYLAACATAQEGLLVVEGSLEEDAQDSVLCVSPASVQDAWTYVPIKSTIVSLVRLPKMVRDASYAALGIAGDVHFIATKVSSENIDEDADGETMTQLAVGKDAIVACGYNSRVYLRKGKGRWQDLSTDTKLPEDLSLETIAINAEGDIAVGGSTEPTDHAPTEEEQAELDHIAETGTMQEYLAARERVDGLAQPTRGCLWVLQRGSWKEVTLPTSATVNHVIALPNGRFFAVGNDGMIVSGKGPKSFRDLSIKGMDDGYLSVCLAQNQILMLTPSHIHVFTTKLTLDHSIPLPKDFETPHTLDVTAEGTIWCFGHTGVIRRAKGKWEAVSVPKRSKRKR